MAVEQEHKSVLTCFPDPEPIAYSTLSYKPTLFQTDFRQWVDYCPTSRRFVFLEPSSSSTQYGITIEDTLLWSGKQVGKHVLFI